MSIGQGTQGIPRGERRRIAADPASRAPAKLLARGNKHAGGHRESGSARLQTPSGDGSRMHGFGMFSACLLLAEGLRHERIVVGGSGLLRAWVT